MSDKPLELVWSEEKGMFLPKGAVKQPVGFARDLAEKKKVETLQTRN